MAGARWPSPSAVQLLEGLHERVPFIKPRKGGSGCGDEGAAATPPHSRAPRQ